eukprot:SAG25_NODE_9914_length_353_cov_0.492126_1_plen_81_part_01
MIQGQKPEIVENIQLRSIVWKHRSTTAVHLAQNFGLTDHLQALRWVKSHIRAFGGAPERILFFGQSSGANHALWIPLMKPF